MDYAEAYAVPVYGELGPTFTRLNDFKEEFGLRWGRVRFNVLWGPEVNVKVLLVVYRTDARELFIVDTDPVGTPDWNQHVRQTRDFFVQPFAQTVGRITCVKFAYIVHFGERSIASAYEYIFMDGPFFALPDVPRAHALSAAWATRSRFRPREVEAAQLQRDVNTLNQNFNALNLTPKFTKGQPHHPYHPKRYIHDQLDALIARKRADPQAPCVVKIAVDCVDDTDFVNHLVYAWEQGVDVQCVVDWRKMTLTNSPNYARLKQARVELIGVICTPRDPLIEVAPDMHTKFLIFGEADCLLGSFNITFDRWWANWESGQTFHSPEVARLLDNIFQSLRGGWIQKYRIDPLSHFNLLYTYGRHALPNGKHYLPHHAILSEILRAQRSIKVCLFLIGDMLGEHHDSVVTALINAHARGVSVQIVLNGHLAREGDPGQPYTMEEEQHRPLLPAVQRLRAAGVRVYLVYSWDEDRAVPYSPLHMKYCIIDDTVVLDGSFNWYNTSVFSHDQLVVARSAETAGPYLYEFDEILRVLRVLD